MNRGLYVVTILAIFLASCEKTVDTPVQPDYRTPFLTDLQISPQAFNTDTILLNGQTDPGDVITLTLQGRVRVDFPTGSTPPAVQYSVTKPSEGKLFVTGNFRDDGISPDTYGGDGVYSGTVSFPLKRVEGGYLELFVKAVDGDGSTSNALRQSIPVFRSSRAPLLSGLSAPDTVILPPPALVSLILMSVTANDSDGPGDIREVFFRNLDSPSDTTRKFLLYDDGDVNGVSGDSVANDGIYSITVQLPFNTPVGTYRFLFEATDRFGLASNTILHPLTVLPPE